MQEDEDTRRRTTADGDNEHHHSEGSFAAATDAIAVVSFRDGNGPRVNASANIGTDMMAVARRIQERALVLDDEQCRVRATEPILLDLCKTLKKEQARNDEQRRELLLKTNERNVVELEIFGVKDSIKEHLKQATAMDQEILHAEEIIAELVTRRTQTTKKVYGPNLASMETYTRVLETIVGSKEKAVEAWNNRLEGIRVQLEDSKTRNENINRETKDTEEAIDREQRQQQRIGSGGVVHDDDDDDDDNNDDDGSTSETNYSDNGTNSSAIGQEDKEITALSKEVREAIEKVSGTLDRRVQSICYNYARISSLVYSYCCSRVVAQSYVLHSFELWPDSLRLIRFIFLLVSRFPYPYPFFSFSFFNTVGNTKRDLLSERNSNWIKKNTTRPMKRCFYGKKRVSRKSPATRSGE
jgi:hypothetical protein